MDRRPKGLLSSHRIWQLSSSARVDCRGEEAHEREHALPRVDPAPGARGSHTSRPALDDACSPFPLTLRTDTLEPLITAAPPFWGVFDWDEFDVSREDAPKREVAARPVARPAVVAKLGCSGLIAILWRADEANQRGGTQLRRSWRARTMGCGIL